MKSCRSCSLFAKFNAAGNNLIWPSMAGIKVAYFGPEVGVVREQTSAEYMVQSCTAGQKVQKSLHSGLPTSPISTSRVLTADARPGKQMPSVKLLGVRTYTIRREVCVLAAPRRPKLKYATVLGCEGKNTRFWRRHFSNGQLACTVHM